MNKRSVLFLFVVAVVLFATSVSAADANSTSCGYINSSDLTLAADIIVNGTCFTFNSSDVILDCAGHTITGNGSGWGVNLDVFNGTSVLNCNIINFSQGISKFEIYDYTWNQTIMHNNINTSVGENERYGIVLINGINVTMFNNTIYTVGGGNSTGIQFNPGINNSNISNNFVNTTGNQSYGIFPADSHYNTFANNVIVTGGVWSDGFDSPGNSSYNLFYNNTIITYGEAGGIDLVWGAHDNNVTNNTIYGYGEDASGLELAEGSYNNTLYGNTIVMFGSTCTGLDIDNALFNIVSYNSFSCDDDEIFAVDSSGLILFRNIFTSNSKINLSNSIFTWSSGEIGNRWRSYDQPSEGCEDANSNGVCDSAYSVATGNTDSYPLALVTGAVSPPNNNNPVGGGGSSTKKTYSLSETQLKEGYTNNLAKGDKMKFNLKNESHSLEVKEFEEDRVNITLSSEPVNFAIFVNENKKFDLDNDFFYDLSIILNSIENEKANLTILEINESITLEVEDKIYNESEESVEIIDEEEKNVLPYIFVSVLIVIIVFVIYFKKRKRIR